MRTDIALASMVGEDCFRYWHRLIQELELEQREWRLYWAFAV